MTPESLSELCRDRPLISKELHEPNGFYGHAELLRRYARWTSAPLKVAIEHGVMFDDYLWDVDLATHLPLFLCAAPNHARLYEARAHHGTRAEPIGPLIGYAASFTQDPGPRERTLLAFPAHSSHHVAAGFDFEAFADVLEREGKHYSRVKVCMYWKDHLHGTTESFQRRGFECVSAGHMYDPRFLFRLVDIIRSATTIITNEIGTCLLYAVLLGRAAWLRHQEMDFRASHDVYARDMRAVYEHPNVQRCLKLFAEHRDDITDEQRHYVDELTGRAYLKTPEELRGYFTDAEQAYQRRARLADRVHEAIVRSRYVKRRVVEMWHARGGVRLLRERL